MSVDLPNAVQILLLAVLILGGSVWLGGFFTLIMVSRSASATMTPHDRVAFFRHFGRRFGSFSTGALLCAMAAGAVLLGAAEWTVLSTVLVMLAVALLAAVGIGVLQAKKMTALRHSALTRPDDGHTTTRIAAGGRTAVLLRAGIGVLSLVLFVLALVRAV